MPHFPTHFDAIWARVNAINPVVYARTRNFTDGAVTCLSPYLTHGVLSPSDILEDLLSKHSFASCEKLIQELAWREFFQLVWRVQGDAVMTDLRFPQDPVTNHGMPQCVAEANTGITALDTSLRDLYETGSMHNHARMWLASVVCNRGQYHWRTPAQWLYYHLLDGDIASNSLSWQWCAGAFASKKYWANQDNINRYTKTQQRGTMMDYPYEVLPDMPVPAGLTQTSDLNLTTVLPPSDITDISGDVLLYHPWSLDPRWQADTDALRVLVLEPSHFSAFPMSQKRIDFIRQLAKEIPNIRIFSGELHAAPGLTDARITYKKHPAVAHWDDVLTGARAEEIPTMFAPNVKYYKSFFAYWKACKKTDAYKAIAT